MYYILSVLFALIPEVLYFTLFISYTKKIQEKRVILFILLSIIYFICMIIQRYIIVYYILFVILIYISMKILYKNKVQIIDVFIISIAYFWLGILSLILMKFVYKDFSNYYIILFIQRIIMFAPIFIFKNKFNNLYKKYCKLWNRNDKEERPIKSITLRNISLILLNVYIFFMNILLIYIINFQK